jgi:hypothetical protein
MPRRGASRGDREKFSCLSFHNEVYSALHPPSRTATLNVVVYCFKTHWADVFVRYINSHLSFVLY